MFDLLFPRNWSTLKKLIWLKAAALSSAAEKTVTAAIVHIRDALAGPAQQVTVAIEPVQAGTGDPSPDNVRPISGWTGANVTRTGKNFFKFTAESKTENGITFSVNSDGSVHVKGTATANTSITSNTVPVTILQKSDCWVSGNPAGASSSTYRMTLRFFNKNGATIATRYINSAPAQLINADPTIATMWWAINIFSGTEVDETFFPMLRLSSDTDSTFAPYTGTVYPISFGSAGTVYGGELDVTNGVLTVDRAIVTRTSCDVATGTPINALQFRNVSPHSSGNVQDLYAKSIANCAKYREYSLAQPGNYYITGTQSDGGNAIIAWRLPSGLTFADKAAVDAWLAEHPFVCVYPVITPQTYQLTPTEIELLLGENNLWSDTGDLTLTYLADGRASDVEALNILLAGRYVNTGAADEATDAEALNILLGRKV